MPNVRCNHFDEKGKILNKRHLNDACNFVHPDNPDWEHAYVSRPRRTEWFPDAWTPDAPTHSSNTTGSATTGRTWGKSAESRSTRKSDVQLESVRDSSKNSITSGSSRAENNPPSSSTLALKEGSTSWADTLEKAAEKGVLNSPWGSSSGNDGWGSGEGSWGAANDTGTSQGQAKATYSGSWGTQLSSANPDQSSTSRPWGDTNKGTGVGREKEKEDITMRDLSPPRPAPSTAIATVPPTISDDCTKKLRRADLPLLDPEVRSARERTPSFSPAPSTAGASRPLPRPVMPLLSKATSAESARNASPGGEGGTDKMSRSSTPTSVSFTKSFKGYKGHAALFSEVVSQLQEAVVFEIVLLRAQAEAMRWKKTTQSSEIYAHSTQKTRTILDGHRVQYNDKMSGARSARDRALNHLGTLLELPTRANQLAGPKLEKDKIRAYTEELKEWLEGLERHRSLLEAKQEVEEAKSKVSHPEPLPGIPSQPNLESLQSLLQREKWSWRDLKKAPSFIELAIEDAQAVVYGEAYTRIDELYHDDLKVLDEQLPPITADERTPDNEIQLLAPRIEANGKNLETQASRAAELLTTIDNLKKEIAEMKAEREKMDEIYAQAEKQFSEFDNNKEADSAKIREMTEQLQNLSLHKRPAAQPSTTLSPVKLNELLEYIRPIVVERVKDDLNRVMQNLIMRCRENQDRMAEEIEEMLRPVLASTEQIRQESLSLSAMAANQPTDVSNATVS